MPHPFQAIGRLPNGLTPEQHHEICCELRTELGKK